MTINAIVGDILVSKLFLDASGAVVTQALVSTGKPQRYWRITVADEFCAIHSGRTGALGEWQLLENLNGDSAVESAADLVKVKQRAGFVTDTTYDPGAHWYFDDPEFGPHRLTTHPGFNNHFGAELYEDPSDDESPFGNDDGADTLNDLQEALQADPKTDLTRFPERIVTQSWEMQYHAPDEPDEVEYWSIGGPGATDQAIVATVFGAIKVTGALSEELKALGLQALKRWQRLGGSPASDGLATMIADLQSFSVS